MSLLQTLLHLQALDQEWDEKSQAFRATRERLVEQPELEEARADRDEVEVRVAEKRSALRDAELQIEGLEEKVEQVEESLYSGRIRAARELEDLAKDRDYLRGRIAQLEDEALEAMTELDDLEQASAQSSQKLETLEDAWSQEHEVLVERYRALHQRLQALQAERQSARQALGSAELALYDELHRSKSGAVLSPVIDNTCQTCRVTVPSYKAQEVKRGDTIVVCEGCGRILYPG
jgi:predicted  nucleic acid-binding Zn-ribbon protein